VSKAAQQRAWPSWLWLTWPVVIFVGSSVDFFIRFVWNTALPLARYAHNSFTHDRSGLKVLKRLDLTIWPTKLLLAAANSFPLVSFSVAVLVWFHRHAHADDRELYVEALATVFLFGWMVDFVLFSGMTEHLYVFLIVLNEIIVQDIILSFILVFVCTVVGFSFALYALRLKAELTEDALVRTTVYDVLVSALGVGSFFEETREQLNDRMGLFRVVFAFYICFTAILLLNVLIAMVNNRYEQAKRRAEGVWRFEIIKTAHMLHDFNIVTRFLPSVAAKCINPLRAWYFRDVYEDAKFSGRMFVDVRLKVENDD